MLNMLYVAVHGAIWNSFVHFSPYFSGSFHKLQNVLFEYRGMELFMVEVAGSHQGQQKSFLLMLFCNAMPATFSQLIV